AGLGRGQHPGVPAHRVRDAAGGRPPGLGDRSGGGGVRQLRGLPAHPLKARCLKHCRSPLSLLLHYGAYRGPLRDVRAGVHHGAYCRGCCWSLMALFVVVGVMNLAAMVVLAAVVLAEKLWVHSELLAGVVGIAALALAITVIWVPELAPGLHGTDQM